MRSVQTYYAAVQTVLMFCEPAEWGVTIKTPYISGHLQWLAIDSATIMQAFRLR